MRAEALAQAGPCRRRRLQPHGGSATGFGAAKVIRVRRGAGRSERALMRNAFPAGRRARQSRSHLSATHLSEKTLNNCLKRWSLALSILSISQVAMTIGLHLRRLK